ncbi:hypothetical protein [Sinorhizobium terangae]|uniref:hypothetical protein n=1 Tax=Sinorhizobium terangae TaxID=110322 RepID=UPI00142F07C1|nr:hypothetical protein [Sinorhizobium terangae]MBB4184253.1 hypothetical protein [Sinorhizobium terangae]WFU51643.1 hypothetical protein QA637_26070 [Sinorhizobium terangae]
MRIVGGTDVGDEADERVIWEIENRVREILARAMAQGFTDVVLIGAKPCCGYDVWSTWPTSESTMGAIEYGKARILACTDDVIVREEDQ